MAMRRIDWRVVKLDRSYTADELAVLLRVHKNTVRYWQRAGLTPLDNGRPALFAGSVVRAFLASRNASRKSPCPPGTLYCFRCRAPRPAALGMVDFVPTNALSGNIRALCGTCETTMHRRASRTALALIMPGCEIQFEEGQTRLTGDTRPSVNRDSRRKATTP